MQTETRFAPISPIVLISRSPIVSSGTLRPDHLCSALIGEADRLGIVLDRDVWQPAAAIVAHGKRSGACLNLPPWLAEISGDVVSELVDALNWDAPSGCSLGSSEGDWALFLWTLSMEAQAEAINADPDEIWEAKTLEVPEHWLSALVNGDETGLSDRQSAQLAAFESGELSDGWRVSGYAEESDFTPYHDAEPYGVLACDAIAVLAIRPRQAV